MATSNFYNENASNIYAVLMNYEDEEGNTVAPEYWECEDTIEELKNGLKELQTETINQYDDCWGHNNCETTELGRLQVSKEYADVEVTVTINSILRHGYYEGANLDWYIQFEVDGCDMDEIDFDDMFWRSDLPKGMQVIQQTNAERWAENVRDELIEVMEGYYKKVSQYELTVSARFSNGETWYEKV